MCPLVGTLSKSKGQILRVAAAFHILFEAASIEDKDDHEDNDEDSQSGALLEISEVAMLASINFVELCCQQTAFMAGRGNIGEDIELIKASTSVTVYIAVI